MELFLTTSVFLPPDSETPDYFYTQFNIHIPNKNAIAWQV